MRRFLVTGLAVVVLAGAVGLWLSRPDSVTAAELPTHQADVARGALVFHATGCASCHAAPDAQGEAKLVLAGGHAFATEFGTFYAPNISPDTDEGIGGWTDADFVSAVKYGTSPEGYHYYPAFPYSSYIRMDVGDILDLKAYIDTLPVASTPSKPHDLGFPFNIRASLGGWKMLYLDADPVVPQTDPVLARGQYLVEAMGHCGECHTPRDSLGGPDLTRWLGGGPNPDGEGTIPNITPGALDWSQGDIAYYLSSGFTPDYDSVGGSMVSVVENLANLPPEDLDAIAAYLKAVRPVSSQ